MKTEEYDEESSSRVEYLKELSSLFTDIHANYIHSRGRGRREGEREGFNFVT